MRLQLVKIEEGLLEGEVLHHSFLEKTEEEKKEIKARMAKRKKEKEQRKRQQDINVRKKEKEKEVNKNKSLEGMKKKEEAEKSWQGEKIAEFAKEQKEKGEEVEDFEMKGRPENREGRRRARGRRRCSTVMGWDPITRKEVVRAEEGVG